MELYFLTLVKMLDEKRANWRSDSIILLDGARYHTSEKTKQLFKRLDLPIVISGPYSYSGAPVERAFAFLKSGDLNPHSMPINSSKSSSE